MEPNNENLYKVLGLQRSATNDDVKKKYRELSKIHHPDKGGDQEFMKKLNLAYKVLSNINLRTEYDTNNEDEDDMSPQDFLGALHMGRTISEDFRQSFAKWMSEHSHYQFVDNTKDSFNEIGKDVFEKLPTIAPVVKQKRNYFCDLCQNDFPSREQHDALFLDPYKAFLAKKQVDFDRIFQSLFKDDVWRWKRVSFTSLKNYTKWIEDEWKTILSWKASFMNGLEVLEPDYVNMWLEFVKEDPSITSLARDLAKASPSDVFDEKDLEELRLIIVKEFGKDSLTFETVPPEKIVQCPNGKDKRVVSQIQLLIAAPSLKRYINKKYLTITVSDLPEWVPNDSCNDCPSCSKQFWFFARKHHCRNCGQIFCADCLSSRQLPKLGYIAEVKTCESCASENLLFEPYVWMENANSAIAEDDLTSAETSLVLSKNFDGSLYKFNDRMLEKVDLFWKNKQYRLFAVSLSLAQPSKRDWKKFLEYMIYCCSNKMYSLLLFIIKKISANRDFDSKFWLQVAEEQLSHESQGLNGILSLFFYLEAGESLEKILLRSSDLEKNGMKTLLPLYLSYAKVKCTKYQCKEIGNAMFKQSNSKLALYFYDASFTKADWIKLLDQFFNEKKLKELLLLLDFGRAKNILAPQDHALCAIFDHRSLDKLLDNVLVLIKKASFNYVSFIMGLILKKYSSLKDEINYCLDKNAYEKLAVCLKVSEKLEGSKDKWIPSTESLIKKNPDAFFQMLEVSELNVKDIGDKYYNMGRYSTALQCYLMQANCSYEYIISQGSKLLDKDVKEHASLFYLQAYKNDRGLKISAFYRLCKLFWDQSSMKELILGFIQQYKVDDNNMRSFHYLLSHIYFKNNQSKEAWQVLHYSYQDQTNAEYMALFKNLQKIVIKENQESFIFELKAAAYSNSFTKLIDILQNLDNWRLCATKEFLKEQTAERDFSKIPAQYRSLLCFVKVCIYIHEKKWTQCLDEIHHALLCFPTQECAKAAANFLQNEELMIHSYECFIKLIQDLFRNNYASLDNFTQLLLPQGSLFADLFKIDKSIGFIRKFEKAINSRLKNDSAEAGYSYLDLLMAVRDPSSSVSCLISAAILFLKAQTRSSKQAEIYAYRNLITALAVQAFVLANDYLNPTMQIYIYKPALALIIISSQNLANSCKTSNGKGVKKPIIEQAHSLTMKRILKLMIRLARVTPVSSIPILSAFDAMFFHMSTNSLLHQHFALLESRNPESNLCPKYMSQYYQLEGAWRGWVEEEFEEKRLNSMKSLLKMQNWTLQHVEKTFSSNLIYRDSEGWLCEDAVTLNLSPKAFTKVNGVRFDLSTGKMELLLEQEMNLPALFDQDDVLEIMRNGIKSTLFTLDQPSGSMKYHPFQDMKYFPKNLEKTRFLETLLHADYLLKMISMGIEVSTKAPFPMRKASLGFMKRLPPDLRELLKPVSERKTTGSNTAHRFWIEAEELPYKEVRKGEVITYYFGKVQMKVKKHLLAVDENGNLVDADQDDDESPEAEFAKTFTDHYETIGLYFPELLRLRELYKIAHICEMTTGLYSGMIKMISSIKVDVKEVENVLGPFKSKITYPRASDYNTIEEAVNDSLRLNGVTRYQVTTSQLSDLRQRIVNQLREVDSKQVQQITEEISKVFKISYSSISNQIHDWLASNSSRLYQTLAVHMKDQKIAQLRPFCNTIESAKFNTELQQENFAWNNSKECSWVPAAFCESNENLSTYKVYGGVHLALKRVEQHLSNYPVDQLYIGSSQHHQKLDRTVHNIYSINPITKNGSIIMTIITTQNPNHNTQLFVGFNGTNPTYDHFTYHKPNKQGNVPFHAHYNQNVGYNGVEKVRIIDQTFPQRFYKK